MSKTQACLKEIQKKGETILYGKIERIGGTEPTVRLRLGEKEVLTCKISQPLAIELASYLYQWVSLNGKAKWNVRDYTVETFEITNFNKNFQDIPLNETFNRLSREMGQYFDDIDPVTYVQKMRGDD